MITADKTITVKITNMIDNNGPENSGILGVDATVGVAVGAAVGDEVKVAVVITEIESPFPFVT